MLQLRRQGPSRQRLPLAKKVTLPLGAGSILTGYRKSPRSAPLPVIKVNIEGVGDVVALVDSGASSSAIRRSLARKLDQCIGPSVRFRSWDNKTVAVDSFVNMAVTWEGRKTMVERVATVKHPPFSVILGVDWIIASKSDLIVKEDKLVPVPQLTSDNEAKQSEAADPKSAVSNAESVRFGDVRVKFFKKNSLVGSTARERVYSYGEKEEAFNVSDELICSFQEGRPRKRTCGKTAKVLWRTRIPSESLKFVPCKLNQEHTGTVLVRATRCSFPGKEFCVPSCLASIRKGVVYVPVLNLSTTMLDFKLRDRITEIDFAYDARVQLVEDKKLLEEEEKEKLGSEEPPMCAAIHYQEPKPFANPQEEIQLGSGLSDEQRRRVLDVLAKHQKCFPQGEKLGSTSLVEFTIDTGDAKPQRSNPIRVSPSERKVIAQKVEKFLRQGLAQPSTSPWAASVVLVKKKLDQDYRFCVDYRRLNAVSKRDVYPLPRIDDVLDRLAGAKWFASIDLLSGYYQVPVAAKDREKTAFITPDGLYEFTRMPQGVQNGPACFQRLMDRVLRHLKWSMCLVYLDDCLVFGSTFDEFLERLHLVLTAIGNAGLTLNPRKCVFATDRVFHLGHVIDAEGIRPNPEKVSALSKMVVKNVKTLRSFIGVASFFRKFVPGFSVIAQPLFRLLKKKVPWSWGRDQDEAKNKLVEMLTSAPVLAHYDEDLEVVVQTDASQEGLGAVLLQDGGDGPRPISYISRGLSDVEKRRHCNELECLALVWALKKFRPYVYGKRFKVETDSSAVKWLFSKREVGKFGRWVLALQEYDFEVCHIRGVTNAVADGLSRNPLVGSTDGFSSTDLICSFISKVKLPTGLGSSELRFQQRLDPQIGPFFSLRKVNKQKFSKHFSLQNGVLYRKTKFGFAMCVPNTLRNTILYFCHDVPAAGHMGVEKTLGRVLQRYWWPRVTVDVRKYVLSCLFCQLHKHQTGTPFGLLRPIPPPTSCFESIVIDHLGPFKLTSEGNRHIIVAIDALSKYVELEAVPDTTAAKVVRFLNNNIVHRFGTPVRVVSDQGTAYTAKEVADAMEEWGIKHVFATGEHPQTSGLVERANRTLTLVLAAYVNTEHNDWDKELRKAAYAINTAKQSATEKMPFELVFGRVPRTPLENALSWPTDRPQSFDEFIYRVDRMRKEVYVRIINKQSKTKALADLRRRVMEPLKPGELVLVRRKIKKKGRTKKLLPKFTGPFQVVKQVGSGDNVCETTYLVEDLPDRRTKKRFRRFNAHVVQIRKFRPRAVVFDDSDDEEESPHSTEQEQPEPPRPVQQKRRTKKSATDNISTQQQRPPLPPSSRGRQRTRPARLNDYVLEERSGLV